MNYTHKVTELLDSAVLNSKDRIALIKVLDKIETIGEQYLEQEEQDFIIELWERYC